MAEDYRRFIATLPKVDLHRHLEGAIRPATMADIGRSHGLELPTYDPDELAALVRLTRPAANLEAFFTPFKLIKFCFVSREAVARIAYEAVEDALEDNIRYLELRFSPEFMAFHHGLALSEVMDGVVEGVELAGRRFAVTAKLIVSISRHLNAETMCMPWPSPEHIARLAVDYADRGVVGLDLSGKEAGYPAEAFAGAFEIGRRAGLGITVHAGEDAGPESVRGAIEVLGAARIGHGVQAARDPSVLHLAVERGICFEVCPTSNVLTRAVETLESHPVRRLYDAGALVTINTDDPTVCGVSLTDEYALLVEKFGFDLQEVRQLVENAGRAAFYEIGEGEQK